ncbi:MAG: SAVED domain-containing protein [Acidimicrobiales bacterium]
MASLSAMVSYSWNDAEAAELIHEELAIRGFEVFHDRCSFPLGSRIGQNMVDAVDACDVFVAYLTPSSLYLGKAVGEPRPALNNEFLPMMQRWRAACSAARHGGPLAPVMVVLTHGLGDPRAQAPQVVLEATGEDISSLWTPVVLDQTTPRISQVEAARVAGCVIRAALAPERIAALQAPIDLVVITRGEGQAPGFVTVDATPSLGGANSRPGTTEDWDRFLVGIRDLQAALARSTRERQLRILARAHLTACLAIGRVFNQAAGWQLVVAGRHGEAGLPPDADPDAHIATVVDRIGGRGAMTVEIDMLGANVVDLATAVIRSTREAPCARTQFHRRGTGDLSPEEIGACAATVTVAIRRCTAEYKPQVTRVFCASPAEFAVLVGSRLTSLHTDLQFYERDGDMYVPSLVIRASEP